MARWRLLNAHYLVVPGNEWQYEETANGKVNRKRFEVPMLLDPKTPGDWNDGESIVVCHEGKGQRRDITFIGDPTPDMEPLDDEAEAISKSFEAKWQHPIDSLPGDFGQSLLSDMQRKIDKMIADGYQIPKATVSVPNDEVEALRAQVAELTALVKAQQPKPEPEAVTRRA